MTSVADDYLLAIIMHGAKSVVAEKAHLRHRSHQGKEIIEIYDGSIDESILKSNKVDVGTSFHFTGLFHFSPLSSPTALGLSQSVAADYQMPLFDP